MAATVLELGRHSVGGSHHISYKVTADAATAVITPGPTPRILGISFPIKTTGSASALTATVAEATGAITISGLTATDVFPFVVITG